MNNRVETKYGLVEGLDKEGAYVFLGIPFAEPPLGAKAFAHPLPPKPFEGVYEAKKGKANPMQGQGLGVVHNNSLDSLYLNVFVPKGLEGKAPVIVWIHGGSFSHGGSGAKDPSGFPLEYDLEFFAKETKTIVVTINYRLNLFGFLDLSDYGPGFHMNNGLFDQIMALKYVKENIASFGGDPDNVTIFGQSAGAASVLALLAMHEARPYFQKAILMSPFVDSFFTKEEAAKLTRKYLSYLHVKKKDINPAYLASLPRKRIEKANDRFEAKVMMGKEFRCAFSPIVDGMTLHDFPKKAISDSAKPILIGHASNECDLFIYPIPGFILPLARRIVGAKKKDIKGSLKRRVSDYLTETVYINPINEVLEAYNGMRYYYRFDHVTKKYKDKGWGAFHAGDIPIVFGLDWGAHEDSLPDDVKVGRKFRFIISSFAHRGSINYPSYPATKKPYILDVDDLMD